MNKNIYEFVKNVAMTAITVCLGMVSFWIVEARHYVKRADVVEMIHQEQAVDRNRVEILFSNIKDFKDELKDTKNAIQTLNINMTILSTLLKQDKTELQPKK